MRIQAIQIGLNLLWRSLVYDLPAHRRSRIGASVRRRRERALHAVNALTEDDFYPIDALMKYDNLQCFATVSRSDFNFL